MISAWSESAGTFEVDSAFDGGPLGLFALMALFPAAFAFADPGDCKLARSLDRPGPGHVFGYDVQGCDYLAETVGSSLDAAFNEAHILAATHPLGTVDLCDVAQRPHQHLTGT